MQPAVLLQHCALTADCAQLRACVVVHLPDEVADVDEGDREDAQMASVISLLQRASQLPPTPDKVRT